MSTLMRLLIEASMSCLWIRGQQQEVEEIARTERYLLEKRAQPDSRASSTVTTRGDK